MRQWAVSLSALLLILAATSSNALNCYVGESTTRDVDPTWPTTICNSTVDYEYDRCYSLCQRYEFQNSTEGGLGIPYTLCKFGCASVSLCNVMERRLTGQFIVDAVCPCYWNTDDVYWSQMFPDEDLEEELGDAYKPPPPAQFCCPMCRMNQPGNVESCPLAFDFVQKCCPADGCNTSNAPSLEGCLALAYWLAAAILICVSTL